MGKGNNTQVWKYYGIEGDKVKRLRRECPRCGRGVFMGEHEDRVTCGRCKYTEFRRRDGSGEGRTGRGRDRGRDREAEGKAGGRKR